jgi:hypothetical protein
LQTAQAEFVTFPGYLLFGAATVLVYHWLHRINHIMLSDHLGFSDQEGVGTEGLRALARGAVAGLFGGLLFTVVMVQIGFLPTVASLVGSTSLLSGFIVHLLIANLIGMSYGLLFHRQSFDLGSALGWGISYGFVWWLLGPLTLLPVFLGGAPQWTLDAARAAFPALIGHIAYGAGLGITFYILEIRFRPWWISRSQAEARRHNRRKEQILTSAPAVWVLVVIIAIILPVSCDYCHNLARHIGYVSVRSVGECLKTLTMFQRMPDSHLIDPTRGQGYTQVSEEFQDFPDTF